MSTGCSSKETCGWFLRYFRYSVIGGSEQDWCRLFTDIGNREQLIEFSIRDTILEHNLRQLSHAVSNQYKRVDGRSQTLTKPPLNAEFLFYLFLTPQNCDSLVGDLEERYKLIHKKFGRRRANFWYWTQTVVSLGPIVWAWAKKVAMKPIMALIGWAVAKGLLGQDSWLVVLVEFWKRIRS